MVVLARDSLGHFTGRRTLYYGIAVARDEDTDQLDYKVPWVLAFDHEPSEHEVEDALRTPDTAFFRVEVLGNGEDPGSWREVLPYIAEHEGVDDEDSKPILREMERDALS